MTYAEKLKDPRWQRKRLEIFQRDGFTCRDCCSNEKTVHLHHCFYQKGDPWDTDEKFLLTLCCDCHESRQAIEDQIKESIGLLFARMTLRVEAVNYPGSDHHVRLTNSLKKLLEDESHDPVIISEFDHVAMSLDIQRLKEQLEEVA